MDLAVISARIFLSAIFIVAGAAKLLDREGSVSAMADFGLPFRLASPIGTILPIVELVTGFALLIDATVFWGALAALLLQIAFIGAIAVNLAQGRRPDCHCFGQLHSSPAGWRTIFRNAAFALLAGFILWSTGDNTRTGITGSLDGYSTTQLIAAAMFLGAVILIAGQTALIARLVCKLEDLRADKRPPSPPQPGAALTEEAPVMTARAQVEPGVTQSLMPDFNLRDLDDMPVSTAPVLANHNVPVLILFLSPDCWFCASLVPRIREWRSLHRREFSTVIITTGAIKPNRTVFGRPGIGPVLIQQSHEVSDWFGTEGHPAAVLVSPAGAMQSPLMFGKGSIETFVARLTGRPIPARQHLSLRLRGRQLLLLAGCRSQLRGASK